MTIAVGVLHGAHVVLAADSQETVAGYWKRDERKISGTSGSKGALFIAGSGRAAFVDAVVEQLLDSFNAREDASIHGARVAVQSTLHNFYRQYVNPHRDSPDLEVELLIGAACDGDFPRLWKTDRNTMRGCAVYGAVGVGSGHALPNLSRLCSMLPSVGFELATPAAIAAYVVYQVKRHVDGCGHYTDLSWTSCDPHLDSSQVVSGRCEREITTQLDEVFRRYSDEIEPAILGFLFGREMPTKMRDFNDLIAARDTLTLMVAQAVRSTTG